jgi:hypothetical protein
MRNQIAPARQQSVHHFFVHLPHSPRQCGAAAFTVAPYAVLHRVTSPFSVEVGVCASTAAKSGQLLALSAPQRC